MPPNPYFHLKNAVVNGGVFEVNINNQSQELGIIQLSQFTSHDAMHDSSARYPPPKCHPGTRARVVDRLLARIKSPRVPFSLTWLYGPFGNGKSSIMQTTIEKLQKSDPHLFGGSFFFKRGMPGCDQAVHLIPTIVFQMANNFPHLRSHINEAMIAHLGIWSKSRPVQLKCLLAEPIQKSEYRFSEPVTIFIDGLDECEDRQAQQDIIQIIRDATFTYNLPLRFIVASRPESHLQDILNPVNGREKCDRMSLVEYGEVDAEIQRYFADGFEKIRTSHFVMKTADPLWPTQSTINTLVDRASGQFLFAETVLKFVGSEWEDPIEQLILILDLDCSSAFSNMDAVFHLILQKCPKRQEMLRLLKCIISFNKPYEIGLTTIAIISQVRIFDANLIIRYLAALVRPYFARDEELDECVYPFLPDRIWVSFFHLSFREFLEDERRSIEFHVSNDHNSFIPIVDSYVAEALLGRSTTVYPHTFWNFVTAKLRDEYRNRRYPSSDGSLQMWPKLKRILLDPSFQDDFLPVSPCSRTQLVCALAAIYDAMPRLYTLRVHEINEEAQLFLQYSEARLKNLLPQSIGKLSDGVCTLVEHLETLEILDQSGFPHASMMQLSALDIHIAHQILEPSSASKKYRACKLRALSAVLHVLVPPYRFPSYSPLCKQDFNRSQAAWLKDGILTSKLELMMYDQRRIHPMIGDNEILKDNELFRGLLNGIKVLLDYEQCYRDRYPRLKNVEYQLSECDIECLERETLHLYVFNLLGQAFHGLDTITSDNSDRVEVEILRQRKIVLEQSADVWYLEEN